MSKLHYLQQQEFMDLCKQARFSLSDAVYTDLLGNPHFLNQLNLWLRLINEEISELRAAVDLINSRPSLMFQTSQEQKARILAEIADGGIDAKYVIDGLLNMLGMPQDKLFDEVHRTNMAKAHIEGEKLVILRRQDGKILKPDGWQPPNLLQIIIDKAKESA